MLAYYLEKTDKQEIKEIVENVADLQDRRQWEQLEQFFIEKPYVDRQSISGEQPAIIPRKRLVSELRREIQAYFYSTKHFIKNFAVKISGNRAKATTKVRDVHFVSDKGDRYAWEVEGAWDYELIKKSGRWQIAKMTFTLNNQVVKPLNS